MGYRSDVAICIYGPKDKMTALVAAARIGGYMPETNDSGVQMFNFHDSQHMRCDHVDSAHMIHAYYEAVTWYDDSEEVGTWTAFLKKAAAFDGLSTEFVRIGEDDLDSEEEQQGVDCQWYLGSRFSVRIDLPEHSSL